MESAVEMSRQLKKQQIKTAREISRSLAGCYQKINPGEWQYLAGYPEWMRKRNRLENEVDGHF